ncbi:hypothetical protein N866_05160 [Actinotalea ferrariae CF5-4]|uniref:Polysaccharide biosynthesis protein n=1 Tax=Actinotalea ferrariae CF5-4 TaxID=948458 RepID=A0A021VUG5_9CELL|nr:hypothetical protein [Actinotalea ferrariae]EYR64768.1 hypothetical protein N866_05160 [Actinotalea ferrariae CF5-4]
MADPGTAPAGLLARLSRSPHLVRHGRALLGVGLVSGVGVAATAAFQFVAIRGLGPAEYAVLASALALLNVASIGSSALRNSVAVAVADAGAASATSARPRRRDGSITEAWVLGAVCTVGLAVAAPLASGGLDVWVLALVALAVAPYFLFSRAQGLLQGGGRAKAVVLWSSGAQVAQLVLAAVVLLLGGGATVVLAALAFVAVAGAVGSSVQAARERLTTSARPFGRDTTVVMALTIVFAWLISMDVVLVRAGAEPVVAGGYAAAVVVVKSTLIVPATLSLYLLPRFVARRGDAAMSRTGTNVTVMIALAGGLAMVAVVALLGDLVVSVFGGGYETVGEVLVPLALAWVPWAAIQALLIRVTATRSRTGLAVLLTAALVQWTGARMILPDLMGFIVFSGVLGTVIALALFIVHLRAAARAATSESVDPVNWRGP